MTQLVNNWILTSCQMHRFNPGQLNSVISKHTVQNLPEIYKPFPKSVHKTNYQYQMKEKYMKEMDRNNFFKH